MGILYWRWKLTTPQQGWNPHPPKLEGSPLCQNATTSNQLSCRLPHKVQEVVMLTVFRFDPPGNQATAMRWWGWLILAQSTSKVASGQKHKTSIQSQVNVSFTARHMWHFAFRKKLGRKKKWWCAIMQCFDCKCISISENIGQPKSLDTCTGTQLDKLNPTKPLTPTPPLTTLLWGEVDETTCKCMTGLWFLNKKSAPVKLFFLIWISRNFIISFLSKHTHTHTYMHAQAHTYCRFWIGNSKMKVLIL